MSEVPLQAIFRTYRYGQKRPVFVYRLVSWGTIEVTEFPQVDILGLWYQSVNFRLKRSLA